MFIRHLGKASALLILLVISLSAGIVFAGNADPMINGKLGCQKQNPGRQDCSSLEVTAVCEGNVAVFTIRNTGKAGEGDMVSATSYRLIVGGTVIQSGPVQLAGGATMQIAYSGGGTVTLEADQQVGHPGSSRPQATLNCGAATTVPPTQAPTNTVVPPTSTTVPPTNTLVPPTLTPTNTIVPPTSTPTNTVVPPTSTPTEELPTETPTEEPTVSTQPVLEGVAWCYDGAVEFVVTNTGSDMGDSTYYYVLNDWGYELTQGWLWLGAGQSQSIWVVDVYEGATLYIDEFGLVVTAQCGTATEEVDPNGVNVVAECQAGTNDPVFTITNNGDDLVDGIPYSVSVSGGWVFDEGWLYLAHGESIQLSYPGVYGSLVLDLNGELYYLTCTYQEPTIEVTEEPTVVVTDEPTEEPTVVVTEEPTVEPTIVVTDEPTVEPTVVVTDEPTAEPTVVVTEEPTVVPTGTPNDGPLGCQQNNPGRLDCSSLEVTVVCEGTTAVFTITNTGDPGEGDMRAPTEYRLYLNNQLIVVNEVSLAGGASMEVTYSGAGRIKLEADQQIGHPGKSLPQATINCTG